MIKYICAYNGLLLILSHSTQETTIKRKDIVKFTNKVNTLFPDIYIDFTDDALFNVLHSKSNLFDFKNDNNDYSISLRSEWYDENNSAECLLALLIPEIDDIDCIATRITNDNEEKSGKSKKKSKPVRKPVSL